MGKYDNQLELLFNDWIKASKKDEYCERRDINNNIIFTYDGLMYKPDLSIGVEDEWEKENKRIMFLLKDQPSDWSDDARKWLKDYSDDTEETKKRKAKNRELRSKFIHNIANLFYGIYNSRVGSVVSFDTLDKEDVKRTFFTKPFAFVECKKQGGKRTISNSKLNYYLNNADYKPLLEKEIKILNPNIIVCTNNNIYNFVINMFGGEDEFLKIQGHNSIRIRPAKNDVESLIILNTYHPSARQSYITFFEGAMDHYRAFLNNSDLAFDL